MGRLAELSVMDLRPDPDRGGEEEAGPSTSTSQCSSLCLDCARQCWPAWELTMSQLLPRLCSPNRARVGGGAGAGRLTTVVSGAAVLDIRTDQLDASTIQLHGQL